MASGDSSDQVHWVSARPFFALGGHDFTGTDVLVAAGQCGVTVGTCGAATWEWSALERLGAAGTPLLPSRQSTASGVSFGDRAAATVAASDFCVSKSNAIRFQWNTIQNGRISRKPHSSRPAPTAA